MPRHRFLLATACVALLLLPGVARAQSTDLSSLLVNMFQADILLATDPAHNHSAHFEPGADQRLAPYLFNQSMISQLSTLPLGSPSGGFSYTFDPETGTPHRSSDSFGPAFTERALTLGRRHWNLGMYYQHASYSSFAGQGLGNGDISFYIQHEHCCDVPGSPPPANTFFEGDLIKASLSLNLSSDTTVFYANYGATDRLDLGVVVPVEHVSMDATINASILRLATQNFPTIHEFPGGGSTATYSNSGSATGVGDLVVRAKYRFHDVKAGGLAAGLDLRLPTGDEKNLLGTGATQARISLIASGGSTRFSPHFNVGYTFTHNGSSSSAIPLNVSDEVDYAGGVDLAVQPKLTLALDLLGRTFRNFGQMQLEAENFLYQVGLPNAPFGTVGPTQTFTANQLALVPGSMTTGTAALGAKYNPWQNLLVSAHVLLPVSNPGLRARLIPVVGLDYAF